MSQPHGANDYHRPNQLWRCAAGCDCPHSPTRWGTCRGTPRCSPRLSVRGKRGVFVASCVFATLGLLLLGLCEPWRHTVLKPGPLSSAHTQALEPLADADRCASCHEAAAKDPLAWIKIASGNVAALSEGQATRCLKCHEKTLGESWARHPHNVSPEALARTTKRITTGSHEFKDLVRVKLAASGEKACSTCHKEHHGAHANLTQLTDQQCQACHVQAFESFANGHPEFRRTLPSRRSRIAFDHVSHLQKHFPGKQHAFACNQCHVDDARRDVKRLTGFAQACGQCHSQPIQAASLEGLVAFSFPTLDTTQLKAAGQDIGSWPAAAEGDFDGSLPSLVQTLLLADDEAAAALEQLGPQFDLSQAKSAEELRAIASLAWAYKRLLNDLADDSAQTIRGRLEKVSQGNTSDEQLQIVLRQLPPALFREARKRWLPGLSDELANAGRAQPQQLTAITTISPQIRSELLIENPLAKRKSPVKAVPGITDDAKSSSKVLEAPTASTNSSGQTKVGEIASELRSEPMEQTKLTSPAASDPSELASGGTWYLDDATLSVRYRPRGHADELLRLMIDVAAAATSHHVPHQGLLPTMLADASFKTCASCHSIDTAGEHYAVNWQVEYRNTSRRHFTEFSHRPHLVQPRLADCTHCHQLNLSSNVLANFATTDPMAHAHDFHPLTKATCATCHTTTQSGGRCTLCHSYHVGAVRGN